MPVGDTMSHEVNPQNPTLEPAATAVVDPAQFPFLEAIPESDAVVSQSADAVMDDVFEDVERILKEGGLPHDVVPPTPKPNPLSSLAGSLMPSLLAPKPTPPDETAIQELDDLDVDDLAAIATEAGDLAPLDPTTTPSPKVTSKSVDQLLLTLAGISVLLTGGLWMMAQIFWKESPTVVATIPVEEVAVASQADQEFMNYLGRSLNVLERKADITQENATVAGQTDLPNISVAQNPTDPPTPPLGRVYVPVYPTTPGTTPSTITTTPVPAEPTVTAAPPVAAPTTPSTTTTAPSPAAPVPNIAAAPAHELVGVLNLGERSAALFEVNGSVQRIELGEMIGSSGWTLVSVERTGEAIIRRNGEVRSVYTGQQF